MTANGAEIRFWALRRHHQPVPRLSTTSPPAWPRPTAPSIVQFATNGAINVYTDRAGNPNGYTTGRLHPGGHLRDRLDQYRIVYDFAAQTYTLSKRASAADAWTQLKAAGATGYAIPLRGANTITATHGTLLARPTPSANLWLDDAGLLADGGIADPATPRRPQRPAALLAADHPADQGGAIDLSWAAATDDVGVTGYKLYRGTAPGVYGAPTTLGRRHRPTPTPPPSPAPATTTRSPPSTPPATRAAQVARGLRDRPRQPRARRADRPCRRRRHRARSP